MAEEYFRAKFRNFQESTAEEWQHIGEQYMEYAKGVAGRIIDHLRILDGDYGGFPVDRLQHCLQTATRAYEGGEDEEYVVCALLHDIGDTLGSYDHGEVAAAILKPVVSEENHWMVRHHQIFQGYDYFHYLDMDRNMRDRYKDHPYYERTLRFCDLYDSAAFDADYPSKPLEFFIPMVESVYSKPKYGFEVKR